MIGIIINFGRKNLTRAGNSVFKATVCNKRARVRIWRGFKIDPFHLLVGVHFNCLI
jgi:hypothetical protein